MRALDGLAAAAAHELGTPLSTIALAAKEMRRDFAEGETQEDLDLILEQVARCRAILGKLRSLGADNDPFASVTFGELLAEVAQPYERLGKALLFEVRPYAGKEPIFARNGRPDLRARQLIENAVHFADETVSIITAWDEKEIRLTITDDGPGFTPMSLTGSANLISPPARIRTSPIRPVPAGWGSVSLLPRT